MNICPHCQQVIRSAKPKIALIPQRDTASMSDAEVFKYYKATDRIETLRFFIRHARMSDQLLEAAKAFEAIATSVKVTPAEFDRQLNALRAAWRKESNARELQAFKDAGYVYSREFSRWMAPEEVTAVPVVFEDAPSSDLEHTA